MANQVSFQIVSNLGSSVPIGISDLQNDNVVILKNDPVLSQSGISATTGTEYVYEQQSPEQITFPYANALSVSYTPSISYVMEADPPLDSHFQAGGSTIMGLVSDDNPLDDQPLKGSRSFCFTNLTALQEVDGISPPETNIPLPEKQFAELTNVIPVEVNQKETKDLLESAINQSLPPEILMNENLTDLEAGLQFQGYQDTEGQFEKGLLGNQLHSSVTEHDTRDVTPSANILQKSLIGKRAGKSKIESNRAVNAHDIRQPPMKKHKYEINTPLVDKNEEKKRKDSQRAKRNRDRQKEEKETLQQENTELKERIKALTNIIEDRYAPYIQISENQVQNISIIFIPCPTNDASSIAEQFKDYQRLPLFSEQN